MNQQGKARVLSSGIVVGDPGKWKIIKDGRHKPPITHTTLPLKNSFASLAEQSTSSANNSPNNSKDEVQSGDSVNQLQGETSKEWVLRTFGSQSNVDPAQAETSQSYNQDTIIVKKLTNNNINQEDMPVEITTGINEIKQNHQIYLAIEESNIIQGDKQECLNLEIEVGNTNITERLTGQENEMAIVEIPKPVQTLIVYSPNTILHDIVSHNIEEVDYGITDPNKIAMGVVEIEEFDEL
ncbi:hypothetical protein KY284_020535 [Solanum tuberosum]|nr:hypothetical protein KY284_020535 [Solanum tuberosum]